MRFDPTLGSNNLGLKKCRIRNHHIFGIARTSAFIWHIWIPLKKFCKRTRRVCVCIVLVHFGRYSQEVNEKSVKLAVWAVSLNFLHDFTLFVVDIHQIRLISLFRHFSDHFHFHPILEQKRVIDLIPCHIPYGWNCPGRIIFQKIVTFFATLTAVFRHFLHWFNCFNYFYGSITCAAVGKTNFLTLRLR